MLIKGLDVLIERNYLNVGRSLSKENLERIYIIKLHMVGVSSKDDPNAIKEILDLVCEGKLIRNINAQKLTYAKTNGFRHPAH
jgi:hypothetical protein